MYGRNYQIKFYVSPVHQLLFTVATNIVAVIVEHHSYVSDWTVHAVTYTCRHYISLCHYWYNILVQLEVVCTIVHTV